VAEENIDKSDAGPPKTIKEKKKKFRRNSVPTKFHGRPTIDIGLNAGKETHDNTVVS
jgi:hypothetical protein